MKRSTLVSFLVKMSLALGICFTAMNAGKAQSTLQIFSDGISRQAVVYIPDSMYQDISNVSVSAMIINGDLYGNNPTTWMNPTIALTDTTYFQYLGQVQFDSTDTSGTSVMHAYRFTFSWYPYTVSLPIVAVILNLSYNGQSISEPPTLVYNCMDNSNCPSREAMISYYQDISEALLGNFPFPYPSSASQTFNSLSPYQQEVVATVLNWNIGNNAPTVSDYLNMLDIDSIYLTEAPASFCVGGMTASCNCQASVITSLNLADSVMAQVPPMAYDPNMNYNALNGSCICLDKYVYNLYQPDSSGYEIGLYPIEAGYPFYFSKVVFDGTKIYSAISYSYHPTALEGMKYTGSGTFSYENGYSAVDPLIVATTFPQFAVSAGGRTNLCGGDSVRLSLSPLTSGLTWSTLDTTPSISVTATGLYFAGVPLSFGCTMYSDTIPVNVFSAHGLAGKDTFICAGNSITIGGDSGTGGGTPPFIFSWAPGTNLSDSTLAHPTATPAATTMYLLTVTDSMGCVGKDSIILLVNPLPTAYASSVTICNGWLGIIEAGGGTNYLWSTGDSSSEVEEDTSGIYTVTVSDANGCSSTAVGNVTVLPTPTIRLDSATVCAGSQATLTAFSSGQFLWSTGDTATSIQASVSGIYTVTVTGNNGCSAIATSLVNVEPALTIPEVTSVQSACSNSSVIFTIDSLPYDSVDNQIEWATNPGFQSSVLINNTTSRISFTVATGTVDTVWLRHVDSVTGCRSGVRLVQLNVFQLPLADAGGSSSVCFGSVLTLGASSPARGGMPPYSYSWVPDFSLDYPFLANPTAYPDTSTVYVLTVKDSNGCVATSTTRITVNAIPAIHLINDTLLFHAPDSIRLATAPADGGSPSYHYRWLPSVGLVDSTVSQPIAVIDSSMTYTLLVTDSNGCTGNNSVNLSVFIPSDSAFIATITDTIAGLSDSLGADTVILEAVFRNIGQATYNDSLTINTSYNCAACIKTSQLRVYVGSNPVPAYVIDSPVFPITTPPIVDSFWKDIRIQEDVYLSNDSCLSDTVCTGFLSLLWKSGGLSLRAPNIPIRHKAGSPLQPSSGSIAITFNTFTSTPPSADLKSCDGNTFTILVTNNYNTSKSFDIIIHFPWQVENFSDLSIILPSSCSCSASHTGGSYTFPVEFYFTSLAGGQNTGLISFTVTPRCEIIDQIISTGAIASGELQVLSSSTHSLDINDRIYINNPPSPSPSYPFQLNLEHPFIEPVDQCNPLAVYTHPVTATISSSPACSASNVINVSFYNSGTQVFDGWLAPKFLNNYTNSSGQAFFDANYDIQFSSPPSISGTGITTVYPSSSPTNTYPFGAFNFSSNHIPPNTCFTLSLPLSVSPTLCTANQTFVNNLMLDWGCPTSTQYDFCETTQAVPVELTSPDEPNVIISRISSTLPPVPFWENSWGGCTHDQLHYLIQNKGCQQANNLHLTVASASGNSFSTISTPTVECYNNSSMSSFTTTSGLPDPCSPPPGSPISLDQTYQLNISSLQAGGWLEITFNTQRQCPNCISPGTGVTFDDWEIGATYTNNCSSNLIQSGTIASAQSISLSGTTPSTCSVSGTAEPLIPGPGGAFYITDEQYARSTPDLGLIQLFSLANPNIDVPNTTGVYPPPPACAPDESFSISNVSFTSLVNGQYQIDPMLISGSGSFTLTTPSHLIGNMPLRGTISVTILSDGWGGGISNQNPVTITNASTGTTWSSSAHYSVSSVISSVPYSGVRYDFDINSLSLLNTDDFNTFFQGSNINFDLVGCCPATVLNPHVQVITSFTPYDFSCSLHTNCDIPLAEQDFQLFIHCPGCITPGFNVVTSSLQRTTLGYQDINDNGIPDASGTLATGQAEPTPILLDPVTLLPSNYSSPIQLQNAMPGDNLTSVTLANISAGSDHGSGFSLNTWRCYWQNFGSWLPGVIPGSSPPLNFKPTLSDVIYQQNITGADLVGLDLLEDPSGYCGTVKYIPSCAGCQPVVVNLTKNVLAWKLSNNISFVCHLTDTLFDQPGALVSTDGFQEGDNFEYRINYHICGNSSAPASAPTKLLGITYLYLMASSDKNVACSTNPHAISYDNRSAPNDNVNSFYQLVPDAIASHYPTPAPSTPLISQIGFTPSYTNGFIELYNPGTTINNCNLYSYGSGGWSLLANNFTVPGASYYLLSCDNASGHVPTPDGSFNASLISSSGTLALISGSVSPSTCPPLPSSYLDLVGYGGSSCYSGSPAATIPVAGALQRNGLGSLNTGNNNADFSVLTAADPKNAHSSVSCASGTNITAAALVSPDANDLFICQSCGSPTQSVYPIAQTYSANWVDNGGCEKQLEVDIISKVGGTRLWNIFPNEFRPVPDVDLVNGQSNGLGLVTGGPPADPFNVLMIPIQDYTFTPALTRSVESLAPRHPSGTTAGPPQFILTESANGLKQIATSACVPAYTSGFTIDKTTELYSVPNAGYAASGGGGSTLVVTPPLPTTPQTIIFPTTGGGFTPNGLLIGDEYFEQKMFFDVTPSCSGRLLTPPATPPQTTTIPANEVAIQVSPAANPVTCTVPVVDDCITAPNSTSNLLTPEPVLTSFISPPTYNYAGGPGNITVTFKMTFVFNSAQNYSIPDLFLFLDNTLIPQGMTLDGMFSDASFVHAIPSSTHSNFNLYSYDIGLNPIVTNTPVDVWVRFRIVNCCALNCLTTPSSPLLIPANCNPLHSTASQCLHLPIYYGWDCNSTIVQDIQDNLNQNIVPSSSSPGAFAQDACFNWSSNFVYADAQVDPITISLSQTSSTDLSCGSTGFFNVCLKSENIGGVGNLKFTIDLPAGVTITSVDYSIGASSFTLSPLPTSTLLATGSYAGLYAYTIDLSAQTSFSASAPSLLGITGLTNISGWPVCVQINYSVDPCGVTIPASLISGGVYSLPMFIDGTAYCGNQFNTDNPAASFTFPEFNTSTSPPSCPTIDPPSFDCNGDITISANRSISSVRLSNLTSTPPVTIPNPLTFRANLSNSITYPYQTTTSPHLTAGHYLLNARLTGSNCSLFIPFDYFGRLQIVSPVVVSPVCNNTNLGSVTLNIMGGNPFQNQNYLIAWPNGTSTVGPTLYLPNYVSASNSVVVQTSGTPSVNISPLNMTFCVGETVTFTANPVNGGTNPGFIWSVSGIGGSSSGSSFVQTFSTAGTYTVSCTMTPSSPCTGGTVVSTTNVTIAASTTPTVSISTTASNSVCINDPVTFTATPANFGSVPNYTWFINNNPGVSTGTTAEFTANPGLLSISTGTNHIFCEMTTSNCSGTTTILSNQLTLNGISSPLSSISPTVIPAVTITTPTLNVCSGSLTTFSAVPVNGGPMPTYQWSINGVNVSGATSQTFTPAAPLPNGASVSCSMSSNSTCTSAYTITNGGHYTITGLQTGTYTITVTDDGKPSACSATVTVNVGNALSTQISTTNNNNVSCQSTGEVALTATFSGGVSPYNYQWSSSTSHSVFSAYSDPLIAIAPGTYTITVTDNNGCTASASDAVGGTTNCCWGDPISGKTGASYTYTGTSSSPLELSAGALGTLLSSGTTAKIALNGYFTVSRPFTIQDCQNITMGPEAQIMVKSSSSPFGTIYGNLTINNSVLQGCNAMWQGIIVEPQCTLQTNPGSFASTTIMDAYQAVKAISPQHASIMLNNTYFYRDYEGVALFGGGYSPLSLSSCHFEFGTITSGTFENDKFEPNSYGISLTGQAPYCGVYVINNSNFVYIGGLGSTNEFIGLNNGIDAVSSTIIAQYNYFNNIQCDFAHYPRDPVDGVAISAIGRGPTMTSNFMTVYNNRFFNDAQATQSLYMLASFIFNNDVSADPNPCPVGSANCTAGFGINQGMNSANTIEFNTFNNITSCIFLGLNAYSMTQVRQNSINPAPLPPSDPNTNHFGIWTMEYPGTNSNYLKIDNNKIGYPPSGSVASGFRNGIAGNGLGTGSEIVDNVINVHNEDNTGSETGIEDWQTGIFLSSCNGTQVVSNCITGLGGIDATPPQYGIANSKYHQIGIGLENSINSSIFYNSMKGTQLGLYVEGMCTTPNWNIVANEFYNNFWGYGTTILGGLYGGLYGSLSLPQSWIGNYYLDGMNIFYQVPGITTPPTPPYAGGGAHTVNFSLNVPTAQNFTTRLYQITSHLHPAYTKVGYSYYLNSSVGSNTPLLSQYWHDYMALLPDNAVGSPGTPVCAVSLPNFTPDTIAIPFNDNSEGPVRANVDSLIINGLADFGDFQNVSLWHAQRVLYEELMNDSSWLDSSAMFRNFYDSLQSSPIAQLSAFQNVLSLGDSNSISPYQHQLWNYLLNVDTLISPDSLLSYMPDSLAIAADSVNLIALLNNAQSINSAISSTLVQEVNEARINAYYIGILKGGVQSLNSSDTAWINWLADACPMVQGDAVFLARSVASLWTRLPYYDDVVLCNPVNSHREERVRNDSTDVEQKSKERFIFVPIPASQYLFLDYHADADFSVKLFTVTGQELSNLKFNGGGNHVSINIDLFETGIYFYEIRRDKSILQRGNLSILKF